MGDPEFEGLGIEAQAFASAEAVGHHHRHMADQAAVVALKNQWQPGQTGIGPQGPESWLGAFRQFPGIVVIPGPVELQLQHRAGPQGCGKGTLAPARQRAEIQGLDVITVDQNRIHGLV